MTDIFLKDFYNNVRDDSWPTIKNYNNFLKLPSYIQEECKNQHNMNYRINEIESSDYWRNGIAKVYRYKNLAYFPVAKCASTYYIDLFHKQLEWEECFFSDLEPDTVCFGLFHEPMYRYLKGIAEWAWCQIMPHYNYDLSKVPASILKTIIIGDCHSLPYTLSFGTMLDKINCIPLTGYSDTQIKQYLNNLFQSQKHNIILPPHSTKTHESGELKLKLYNLVEESFENSIKGDITEFIGRPEFTYILLSADLKFYRNLIHSFDPQWQQIKKI